MCTVVSPLTFVISKGLKLLVSERERAMSNVAVSTHTDAVPGLLGARAGYLARAGPKVDT